MDDDQERRNSIRSALLGKTDALRQLLGIGSRTEEAVEPEIPVLHDMLESALNDSRRAVDGLPPKHAASDLDRIPLLTETADGEFLVNNRPDLRALLQDEADRLVEETINEILPTLEQRLRDGLEDVYKKHIDTLLDKPDAN